MPEEKKYLSDDYGVESIGKGVVSGEELYNTANVVYSGDTLLKQKYLLINFVHLENLDVSTEDIVKLANQDIAASKTNPNILIAIVGEQDVVFGLARMWEAHVYESAFETMVFREREEAVAWINKKIDERK